MLLWVYDNIGQLKLADLIFWDLDWKVQRQDQDSDAQNQDQNWESSKSANFIYRERPIRGLAPMSDVAMATLADADADVWSRSHDSST